MRPFNQLSSQHYRVLAELGGRRLEEVMNRYWAFKPPEMKPEPSGAGNSSFRPITVYAIVSTPSPQGRLGAVAPRRPT
jgi:hypothetical protein